MPVGILMEDSHASEPWSNDSYYVNVSLYTIYTSIDTEFSSIYAYTDGRIVVLSPALFSFHYSFGKKRRQPRRSSRRGFAWLAN
jgi:hypothetical protein